jgi:hypothetical protein
MRAWLSWDWLSGEDWQIAPDALATSRTMGPSHTLKSPHKKSRDAPSDMHNPPN